jgi:hypothetical protein
MGEIDKKVREGDGSRKSEVGSWRSEVGRRELGVPELQSQFTVTVYSHSLQSQFTVAVIRLSQGIGDWGMGPRYAGFPPGFPAIPFRRG